MPRFGSVRAASRAPQSLPRRRVAAIAVAAVLGVVCPLPSAFAQQADWPARPIRFMTPNAPGSSIDTLARIVGTRLGEALGTSVVIENRAGASGAIGMEVVKTAPPDGYTIAIGSASSLSAAPVIQKAIRYDPVNDFSLVSLFAVMPNVLIVNSALPVRTVRELIEYARKENGKVNMASAGPGAASHLAGVLLLTMGSFESLHVPYKGGGPSVASVVSGETQWSITPAPAAMSVVKGGRVRAIAHTLDKRSPMFGDLPTVAETVPGYDYSGWAGIVGPKGLPAPIVEKLRGALGQVLAIPQVRDQMAAQGAETVNYTPDEFRTFLAKDLANTQRVVKAAGIQPE